MQLETRNETLSAQMTDRKWINECVAIRIYRNCFGQLVQREQSFCKTLSEQLQRRLDQGYEDFCVNLSQLFIQCRNERTTSTEEVSRSQFEDTLSWIEKLAGLLPLRTVFDHSGIKATG